MNPDFSVSEYASALSDIAPHHERMLLAHYHAPEHRLTARQMAKIMGYSNFPAASLHYGKLGRLVGNRLGWKPLPRTKVFVLAEFEKDGEWNWIMRPNVSKALEKLGLVKDELPFFPEEIDEKFFEGRVRQIKINAYERDIRARQKCIQHHGCRCVVCGCAMSEIYGETAEGFIHVHHLKPISGIKKRYQVDPIKDLCPVCPNCHAIIHMAKEPLSIANVRGMIKRQNIKRR